MNTRRFLAAAASAALLSSASASAADDFGTAEEARAMLERAIVAVEADKEAALESFTAGSDGFKDRDLYVACFEQGTDDLMMTAHGGLASLVGTPSHDLTDAKGVNLGELLDRDTGGEIETATYWWPRPGSEEAVEKVSFYVTVDGQNCLVGHYR